MCLHGGIGNGAAVLFQPQSGARFFRGVFEIRELRFPIVPLLVQEFGEFQQATISGPVVEPQDRIDVILPAVFTPIPEWPARQFAQLIREILPHDGYYARIATDLLVLSKDLE